MRLHVLLLTVALALAPSLAVAAEGPDATLPDEARAWLEGRDAVRVGWSRGIEPVAVWDGDEAVGGFGVDAWDLGAVKLGVRVEHVPFPDIPSVVEALRTGQIDVAGTHAARPDLVAFAEMARPNAWERLVLVTRADNVPVGGRPTPGQTASTVLGSPLEDVLAEVHPELVYVESATIPDAVDALVAGDLDYYLNGLAFLGWLGRNSGVDVVPVGEALTITEIGSWSTAGSPAALVSSAVRDAVSDDELALLHSRWTGFDLGDPAADDGLPGWVLPVAAGLLALAALLGVTNLVLRRRVAAATAELRHVNDGLEQTVAARTEDLAASSERLRQSNEALQRFAAQAAHDIKGPLSAVVGMASLLERNVADPVQTAELGAAVHRSGRRLVQMVDAMLDDAARIGTATAGIDGDAYREWVDEVCGPEVAAVDGVLVLDVPDVPIGVDVEALRRATVNLVTNAVKYGAREGERLRVHVALRAEPGEWVLVVEDDGPGIPAPMRSLVFQQGRRLHDDGRGWGMGLSSVRDHLQAVGGSIALGEAERGGARFIVRLPVSPLAVPSSGATSAVRERAEA